jgi:hypothetical protein
VAWDERDRGLDGPVSVRSMDVGVTKAGSLNPDKGLTRTRIRLRNVLYDERLTELVDDCSFHDSFLCATKRLTASYPG